MHLLKTLAAALALAAEACAGSSTLFFTSQLGLTYAGDPLTIKYVAPDMTKAVKVTLLKGDGSDRKTVKILSDSSFGGSFSWIPPTSLKPGVDYALEIEQGTEVNYSPKFTITGASSYPVMGDSNFAKPQSSIMIDTQPPPKATKLSVITYSGSSTLSSYSRSSTLSTKPASVTVSAGSQHLKPGVMPSLSSRMPLASTMSTIPMSRNATFSSPTISKTGSGGPGPTATTPGSPGSTGSPGPSGSDATSFSASFAVILGAAIATLASLF